jgi:hypothetical protein
MLAMRLSTRAVVRKPPEKEPAGDLADGQSGYGDFAGADDVDDEKAANELAGGERQGGVPPLHPGGRRPPVAASRAHAQSVARWT